MRFDKVQLSVRYELSLLTVTSNSFILEFAGRTYVLAQYH